MKSQLSRPGPGGLQRGHSPPVWPSGTRAVCHSAVMRDSPAAARRTLFPRTAERPGLPWGGRGVKSPSQGRGPARNPGATNPSSDFCPTSRPRSAAGFALGLRCGCEALSLLATFGHGASFPGSRGDLIGIKIIRVGVRVCFFLASFPFRRTVGHHLQAQIQESSPFPA